MTRKETYAFRPDYAVAPGESLRETIADLGMSQVEFAQRMGLTVQSLSRILKGDQPITYDTARKLELVTGISCEYWNNLEARYREQLQVISLQKQRSEFELFNKQFPVKELVNRGYIRPFKDPVELCMDVLSFFQISSIAAFEEYTELTMAAARSSAAFATTPVDAVTYINMGLHEARKISVEPYSEDKFKQVLGQVKTMTKDLPAHFCAILQELYASAGVALVFIPPFKGVHFSGVSKWISATKAMIIMNIRGKAEDKFWFSLFHEAAHILKHAKKRIYIANTSPSDPEELDADKFAADFLIPAKYNDQVIAAKSPAEIIQIARELDISAGIVAGRYQYLTQRWQEFKSLIRPLMWVADSSAKEEK
jgi:addiction module HigA family antidote